MNDAFLVRRRERVAQGAGNFNDLLDCRSVENATR
jgi:hypothetical protein